MRKEISDPVEQLRKGVREYGELIYDWWGVSLTETCPGCGCPVTRTFKPSDEERIITDPCSYCGAPVTFTVEAEEKEEED